MTSATNRGNTDRAGVRWWTRTALMTAAAVASGYLLIAVPNVELITATVAVAGWMLGASGGVLVGVVSMAIFGALNVYGLPYPPVWAAQMFGQALTGFLFGRLRGTLNGASPVRRIWLSTALGGVATLVYDAATNVAFPIATGVPVTSWWPYLIAALPFTLVHLTSNLVIFATLVPAAYARIGSRYSI